MGGDKPTDRWYGGSMVVIFKRDVQVVERGLLWVGLPSTRATPQIDVNMGGGWDVRIEAYAIMPNVRIN